MAKNKVLGLLFQDLLNNIGPKLSEGKKKEIEGKIQHNMAKTLGHNWMMLPISGPYLMILTLILNIVLLPYGITPAVIADLVLLKADEYEIDDKFGHLIESGKENLRTSGEYSSDKLKEFVSYAETTGKKIKIGNTNLIDFLISSFDSTKGLIDKGIRSSITLLGKIKPGKKQNIDDLKNDGKKL